MIINNELMEDRVNKIISEIKKRGLTGYKIAEDTSLTEVGVNKILNGTSKKPRESTLVILEKYLHNNYANEDQLNKAEESKTKYGTEEIENKVASSRNESENDIGAVNRVLKLLEDAYDEIKALRQELERTKNK